MNNPELYLSSFVDAGNGWTSYLASAKYEIKKRFHLSYADIQKYNVSDFLPLDTGAALFWKAVQGNYDDENIVGRLLDGTLLGDCRFPDMRWDKYLDRPPVPWSPGNHRDLHCCYVASLTYMASIARVARLNNDQSLCELFSKVIDDFYVKNTPSGDLQADGRSLFWGDMRAAWRVQTLWLSFYMLCDCEYISDRTWLNLFHVIFNDSSHLYNYNLKHGFKKWNHHSHNMVAIVYSATLMPDMLFSDEWYTFAVNEIKQHGLTELYPDGGSMEVSPSYSRFVSMHYRDTVLLADKNSLHLPDGFRELTRKQLQSLIQISQPDNTTLPINDSCELSCDFDSQVAQTCFGLEPACDTSALLPDSQIAIMRSTDKSLYLSVDATNHKMSHWHGGKPGFTLWTKRGPLLIEAGMPHYSHKDFFIHRDSDGTSHNTVRVDRRGDTELDMKTKWLFKSTAECKVLDWTTNDKVDYLHISNDGYMSLEDPVSFTRSVLYVKDEYFIITDSLQGKVPHSYEWLAHFPPNDLRIEVKDHSVHTTFKDDNVLLQPLDMDEIQGVHEHNGMANVRGVMKKIPYISYFKYGRSFNPHIFMATFSGASPSVNTETLRDDPEIFICRIDSDRYSDWYFERRNLSGCYEYEGISFESDILLIRKNGDSIERLYE